MPPAGAKPKAGPTVTRHQPVHDWLEVEDVPFDGDSPALPDAPPGPAGDGGYWPQRTRDKWDAWRTMPHCKHWGPAEWDYALDSIGIAALFHLTGEQKYATELRNREKVLGTTLDFRRSLRIRYVEPKPDTGDGEIAGVTNIADYLNL